MVLLALASELAVDVDELARRGDSGSGGGSSGAVVATRGGCGAATRIGAARWRRGRAAGWGVWLAAVGGRGCRFSLWLSAGCLSAGSFFSCELLGLAAAVPLGSQLAGMVLVLRGCSGCAG